HRALQIGNIDLLFLVMDVSAEQEGSLQKLFKSIGCYHLLEANPYLPVKADTCNILWQLLNERHCVNLAQLPYICRCLLFGNSKPFFDLLNLTPVNRLTTSDQLIFPAQYLEKCARI